VRPGSRVSAAACLLPLCRRAHISTTSPLEAKIKERLAEEGTVFVFPSEVAAAFWRRHATTLTPAQVVREDRFISWDRFKEETLQLRRERRPANNTIRTLFAAAFLRENSRTPRLASIVERSHAEISGAFTAQLRRILPVLSPLLRQEQITELEPALGADLKTLGEAYGEFLTQHALFEPGWESVTNLSGSGRYLLIYPDLLEDLSGYELALHAAPNVELFRVRETSPPTLTECESSLSEIRRLFSRLETLLDQGVPAWEMAVTVPDLQSVESYVRRYAGLHDVPLDFRGGHPLAEYTGGAFFTLLQEVIQTDFSFDAVKALLANRAIPWKTRGAALGVIRAGIDGSVLRRRMGQGAGTDAWRRAFDMRKTDPAATFYRMLARRLQSISRASGFAALRRSLYELFGALLDTQAWDEENLLVFQSCMDVLAELIQLEERISLQVSDPLSLFTTLLSEKVYVPRGRKNGIPVYSYRVSAGIQPRFHFVINASHGGTRAVARPYSFLREDVKEKMRLSDVDLSLPFLNAYAVSGEEVDFSYARETFDGPRLAAGWFVAKNNIHADENAPERFARDLFSREELFWAGGTDELPASLYVTQRQGISWFESTAMRPAATDFGTSLVEDAEMRGRLLPLNEKGALVFSASQLDRYRSCPFSYFVQYGLSVSQEYYSVHPEEPADIGMIYHHVLEELFRRVQSEGKPLSANRLPDYMAELADVIHRSVTEWAPAHTAVIPARLGTLEGPAASLLEAAVGRIIEQFEGMRVADLERKVQLEIPGKPLVLSGKIDLVLEDPGNGTRVVVDYKKRNLPHKNNVNGGEKDAIGVDALSGPDRQAARESLSALQIPFYVRLLGADRAAVNAGYYLSIEKDELQCVFSAEEGGGWMSADRFGEVMTLFEEIVQETTEAIIKGDFRYPDPDTGCESCVYRGICRTKFVVR